MLSSAFPDNPFAASFFFQQYIICHKKKSLSFLGIRVSFSAAGDRVWCSELLIFASCSLQARVALFCCFPNCLESSRPYIYENRSLYGLTQRHYFILLRRGHPHSSLSLKERFNELLGAKLKASVMPAE